MASKGGLTCWNETVHYLLRSNATETTINQAIASLRDMMQTTGETEKSVNVAAFDTYKTHERRACLQLPILLESMLLPLMGVIHTGSIV